MSEPRLSPPALSAVPRPSTWFTWHGHLVRPGLRVLDLACGEGRHAIAAAALGAEVVGVDRDAARIDVAREVAGAQGLSLDLRIVDLEGEWPDLGTFGMVLAFNYLDRTRMTDVIARVAPGGVLMMETFLVAQRDLGWGPRSDTHLLAPGELARLVVPLEVVHGREVYEPVDTDRWRAVAGVVAERRV
ncbi:MAG: class I SAM-dependent methyltransferase [Gemmatimonadales bacterium]